jgi:phosphoglycerol transferase
MPAATENPPAGACPGSYIWAELALCCISSLLSICILIPSLALWRADLHVPFDYRPDGHDAFVNMMLVKTVIETGWTAHNPRLGAPDTLDLLDFPIPEWLGDGAMLGLSFFSHDFGLLLNLYFLLAFPLIAFTATLATRQIGLGRATSILIVQLFTFLPYHFWRGEGHLALGAYYALPLVIPSILAIGTGAPVVGAKRVTAVIGFATVALSNPYYAAFAAFFLFIAACYSYIRNRDRAAVKTALVFAAILCGVFLVQIIPNLLYTARFGPNPAAIIRSPFEGDLYSLRIAQMLLPVPGHRISALAQLRAWYASTAPAVNENEASTLGIVGSCGFLILLFRGLFKRPTKQIDYSSDSTLDLLALLLIAGILFATFGGFGPTLNYFGFKALRAYNRISIFLAFFSLLAVGILLDRLAATYFRGKSWHAVALCCLILCLGLLDQISPQVVPNYQPNQSDFASDAKFVTSIESQVPAGAAIFQLPLMSYPESTSVNDLGDYELFRGYLHSSKLRWSYGAMRGREASQWQRSIFSLPFQTAIAQIQAGGFSGIYLDRRGFRDDAAEKALRSLLGPPMVSANGRLVFFKMIGRQPTQ